MQMGSSLLRNDIFSFCLQLILCFISFVNWDVETCKLQDFFEKGNLSFLITLSWF